MQMRHSLKKRSGEKGEEEENFLLALPSTEAQRQGGAGNAQITYACAIDI